jgi:7,8-dihydropterin-6-yl-methyl-4-(beta-D-ribofuranosyl)aminobenzene 5'-phosphate synthase
VSGEIIMRRVMILICSVCLVLATLCFGLPGGIRVQSDDEETVRITILYDNYLADEQFQADWGFAALVEYGEQTILFDTGRDGAILMANMDAMRIDPTRITTLVLSHEHLDHTGGMAALFEAGATPDTVFVLPSFSDDLKRNIATVAEVIEVEPGQEIAPGMISTGELTTGPCPEQALLIDTLEGLIVMTGCAHPGIVEVVRTAGELTDRSIALVMGGFHLEETGSGTIKTILRDLHDLGVAQVAPSHCTGDRAIQLFRRDYGEDYVALGVGSVLEFAAVEPAAPDQHRVMALSGVMPIMSRRSR